VTRAARERTFYGAHRLTHGAGTKPLTSNPGRAYSPISMAHGRAEIRGIETASYRHSFSCCMFPEISSHRRQIACTVWLATGSLPVVSHLEGVLRSVTCTSHLCSQRTCTYETEGRELEFRHRQLSVAVIRLRSCHLASPLRGNCVSCDSSRMGRGSMEHRHMSFPCRLPCEQGCDSIVVGMQLRAGGLRVLPAITKHQSGAAFPATTSAFSSSMSPSNNTYTVVRGLISSLRTSLASLCCCRRAWYQSGRIFYRDTRTTTRLEHLRSTVFASLPSATRHRPKHISIATETSNTSCQDLQLLYGTQRRSSLHAV
jgi:hypothetical protein